jgi:betaine-aldehyde dehydrogenase
MVRSPDVDVISFTGSSAVGKKIMAAAAPTLKRLNLELGGKAPAIVLEDCDVDVVACRLAVAGMVLSGEQCTAVNRVLVHASRLSDLRAALTGALSAMRVGRVDAPDTELGPLIDHRNRDRIRSLVAEAEAEGRAVLSGTVPRGDLAGGAFLTPSLLAVDDLESPYVQEEFFGPVMNLESSEDDADAVRRANATRYGLSASVWTNDFARAHRIARALRSGTVWINEHNRLLPEVETGGFRDSGFGRLHGVEGLGEFLATKHIYQPHGQI